MRRTNILFSLIVLSVLAMPMTAGAIEFGGIAAQPANPVATDDRTKSWFIYSLVPGETKSDALLITNQTDREKTLDLYPADSTPTTGEGFALKQQAETMTDVGSWIELEKNSITLKAHEQATVAFTIAIPADLAPGLYSGGIMAAERETKDAGNGLGLNMRVGTRVYVTVNPAPAPTPTFADLYGPYIIGSASAVMIVAISVLIVKRKRIKFE